LVIFTKVLGEQHPELLIPLNNLGVVHKQQREFQKVQTYYEQALAIGEQILSRQHPDIATFLGNLGNLLLTQRKYQEAWPHLKKAMEIYKKTLGKNHEKTRRAKRLLEWATIGRRGKRKRR